MNAVGNGLKREEKRDVRCVRVCVAVLTNEDKSVVRRSARLGAAIVVDRVKPDGVCGIDFVSNIRWFS